MATCGNLCSHPWVSKADLQAAMAPCADVRGAAEVERTVAPEILAGIHGAAEESGKQRQRPALASLGL